VFLRVFDAFASVEVSLQDLERRKYTNWTRREI